MEEESLGLTVMFYSFVDEHKLLPLCAAIQAYYKSIKATTKVLPASLTSTEEIFQLAGADHLTIAPRLLEQLALPMGTNMTSLFDAAPTEPVPAPGASYLHDAGRYQIIFARDRGGASQIKLTEVCECAIFKLRHFTNTHQGDQYLLRFPG